jgi:hypothetical protein
MWKARTNATHANCGPNGSPDWSPDGKQKVPLSVKSRQTKIIDNLANECLKAAIQRILPNPQTKRAAGFYGGNPLGPPDGTKNGTKMPCLPS